MKVKVMVVVRRVWYVTHVDVQGLLVREKFGLFEKALARFLDLHDLPSVPEVRLYSVPSAV